MKLASLTLLAGLAVVSWTDTASAQRYYEGYGPRYERGYDDGRYRERRGGGAYEHCLRTRSDDWTCGPGGGGRRAYRDDDDRRRYRGYRGYHPAYVYPPRYHGPY